MDQVLAAATSPPVVDSPALPQTASDQPGYRPTLSGAQLEVLHRYGTEHPVAIGDVLSATAMRDMT